MHLPVSPDESPVNDLSLRDAAALLTGGAFWSTAQVGTVPSIVLADGPHGVRLQKQGTDHLGLHHSEPATCFPLAVAVGSSWNPQVAEQIGAALARECRELGVSVLLGPGVNIKRSALGGRNFEYYSEDPLLTGVLASAHVKALQAGGVGASLKHFAANDQETDRMIISSDVDERTLREIHLAPFERVVTEAQPATVMCSYNKINGVYSSENRWLLTDVLRGQWGFGGVVVSDWGAVHNRVRSLEAGLDLAMPGPGDLSTGAVVAAVDSGLLDDTLVRRSASVVAGLVQKYAAASTAAQNVTAQNVTAQTVAAEEATAQNGTPQEYADYVAEHHQLARDLATECAVLLKNDNHALPLTPNSTILVTGELAVSPRFQGGGSSYVNATQIDVPLHAIEEHAAASNCTVLFERGVDSSGDDSSQLRAAAVAAAKDVDVAVVFAGTLEAEESEGYDRTHLDLSTDHVALIKDVSSVARRTVVVLSNGGVVTLEAWHDDVDAILEGFLLGQGSGQALADLLFGIANPSGRLAETIPLRLEDTPSYLNFPGEQGHVRYAEGVMVGYRHYETVQAPVRYPFGHGLSYTTFDTTDLHVTETGPDSVIAQVTVTNTGSVTGKHVVQLYVSTQAGPVRRAARTLGAFTKVELAPGQSKVVHLELDRRAFAYWDIDRAAWVVAEGSYAIQLCANSSTVLSETSVNLAGDGLPAALSLQSNVGEWLAHPVAGAALTPLLTALISQAAAREDDSAQVAAAVNVSDLPDMVRLMPMIQLVGVSGGAIDPDKLLQLTTGVEAS